MRENINSFLLLRDSLIFLVFSCVAFIASVTVLSTAAYAVEDRTFDSNAMAVRDRVDRILITEGYCASSNDCRKMKIIFFNPRSDGFDVHVYGVNDQLLVNRIVMACLDELLVAKFNFSVRTYSVSKDVELSKPIWHKPPYSEFTFKLESK